MRKAFVAVCVLTAILAAPHDAHAWGFAAHKLIMARAIDLLPPAIKPFFDAHRDEVVMRSVDPDLWRNVGWEDDPNHFLDFGVPEYGRYPFAALPREYGSALEKFGIATLRRNGTLPWRAAEEFGNLRRGFEGFARNAPYAVSDVTLFTAVAGHYLQDAHQPFHATDNYDGQQTGNQGIHARFERDLVERFAPRLRLNPAPPTAMTSARDAAFDALAESFRQVDGILQADNEAKAGKDVYDDQYFEKFFEKVEPVLERQLSASISATAAMIVGAWEEAGKPAVRTTDVRPLQRIRR